MKEQYVGDISDYRKYALLRVLAADGANRVGVCWMLTPSDGSTDGNKLTYFGQPEKHRAHDPALFDILAYASAEPDRRRLETIEESGAIPCARYFNEPLSDGAAERRAYMDACLAAFADRDLVVFDPDNGLEVPSLRVGRKNSSKYVYLDEVRTFFAAGKSVLIYQHFPRVEREAFVATCVERLGEAAPDAVLWAFRTKHVVFLLAIHPDANPTLAEAAKTAASRWDPTFLVGTQVSAVQPGVSATFGGEPEPLPVPADTPAPASREPEPPAKVSITAADGDDAKTSSLGTDRPSLLRRLLRRLG